MKLPKGIKRMRTPASGESLSKALDLMGADAFNGYIRTTAPKGIKEASVIIFLEGRARIAVFQSPQRSLYGPDALHEVKRISGDPKSTIRVEEFLAQNLEEVEVIVKKMKKAQVETIDIERVLMGIDVEEEGTREDVATEDEIASAIESELEEGKEGPEEGSVRAKVADRIARSKEASVKDDDEFLRMMKEAGMSPPSDDEPMDDEVNQYIAAFEDFIQRSGEEEAGVAVEVDVTAELTTAVDDILDEILEAAADDPAKMEIIENQREKILAKIASIAPSVSAKDRHDRLSEQQVALEHISSTFSEVLAASEQEAKRRREELDERRSKGEADEGLLDEEADELDEEEERQTDLQTILDSVLATHRERLDGAEMDMLDEEAEAEAERMAEEERAKQELDLEGAKEEFLAEMRSRISRVANGNDAAPKAGKVADAVHIVADDLQERVDELEQEEDELSKEREVIESQAEALKQQVDTMTVDMEVEVQARLRDLEEKERELEGRVAESKELEQRLETERSKVEKDLANARSDMERVERMETTLNDREELLATREKELQGKHQEVDGLKEHLEEEIAVRASELEEMESKLKAREEDLLAKEKEIEASVKAIKKKREEGVEADLERVKELEEQLREREAEYSDTISTMEKVVEALQEELKENIEKVEALQEELKVLHETEERVKELEEQLASAPEVDDGAAEKDKEELRRLLAYLDDLLSKLPEKEIEKFSKTEYFELYGRVLDRLGI